MLFTKADHCWETDSVHITSRTISFLQQAMRVSDYALAYAGLVRSYILLPHIHPPGAMLPPGQAKERAQCSPPAESKTQRRSAPAVLTVPDFAESISLLHSRSSARDQHDAKLCHPATTGLRQAGPLVDLGRSMMPLLW